MGNDQTTFKAMRCSQLDISFEVARDKFDVDRFRVAVTEMNEAFDFPAGVAHCATRDSERTDYHAHFQWDASDDEKIEADVQYHIPSMPAADGETDPYAEELMAWLGKFFKNDSAHAAVRASFWFPDKERQSKFPLPMKLPSTQGMEVEMDGVSWNLPSKPSGVEGILLMSGKTGLSVRTRGSYRIKFAEFDPLALANDILGVISVFTTEGKVKLEEKK